MRIPGYVRENRAQITIGAFLGCVALVMVLLLSGGTRASLVVSNAKVLNYDDGRFVTGVVENTASREYSRVKVFIDLMNDSGEIVGLASASTDALAPGETWQFSLPIRENDVVDFKATVYVPEGERSWLPW